MSNSPFNAFTVWAPIVRQTVKEVIGQNPNPSRQEIIKKTVERFNQQGTGCQINQNDVRRAMGEQSWKEYQK